MKPIPCDLGRNNCPKDYVCGVDNFCIEGTDANFEAFTKRRDEAQQSILDSIVLTDAL